MVAKINNFYSRASIGMRAPRSVSRNITPSTGGVAVHWGGPRQGTTGPTCNCRNTWLAWQRFHMDSRGWVDIAYSFGFCNHGNVFAGRGLGVRTAANGTNDGNQRFYAATWIGGQGDTHPNKAALDALEWCILEARRGGAGRQVLSHRTFTGTTCPGPQLANHAASLHNKTISTSPTPTPTPTPTKDFWEENGMALTNKEKAVAEQFIKYLAGPDGVDNGASFPRQLLQFHREEREKLNTFVEDFEENELKLIRQFLDAIEEMNSSPAGQGRALAALWREAGARGWERNFDKFRENRAYTEEDLDN